MNLNSMVHMFWRKSSSVIMEIVFLKSHIKSNVVQHEKGCKFNPNKKEYKCEICGKGKFYLYKKVQEHKRKDHKGYK